MAFENISLPVVSGYYYAARGGIYRGKNEGHILSSGNTTSCIFSNGAAQYVASGGSAYNSLFTDGGRQFIIRGEARYTTVMWDSVQTISSGGRAYETELLAASQHVQEYGYASSTYISSGALQTISGVGACAESTYILSGGSQIIQMYGFADVTKIYSGGLQIVSDGGQAEWVEIYSGGKQIVKTGGVVYRTSVFSGASQIVEYRGIVSGGIIYQGGTQVVYNGAVVRNTNINEGSLVISAKGSSVNTNVNSGGQEVVDKNGATVSSIVRNGATQKIKSGGIARATTVKAGGTLVVNGGGIASDTRVQGKGSAVVMNRGHAKVVTVEAKGVLTGSNGAKITSATLKKGAIVNVKGTVSLAGQNEFLGVQAKGTGKAILKVANKASLELKSLNSIKSTTLSVAAGGTITATGLGNIVQTMSVERKANVVFDLNAVSAKSTTVMLSTINAAKVNANFLINTAVAQKCGTYELAKNLVIAKNTAFGVEAGNGSTRIKVNGGKAKSNGVEYSLTLKNNKLNLTLNPVAGMIAKGKKGVSNLAGSNKCDIFSGGANVSRISGGGGRDVVVYGDNDWGNNVITKTNGTMTIMLAGFTENDVTVEENGKDMIIIRDEAPEQFIQVKNWNDATHNIVYGGTVKQFTKYLKTSRPNATLTRAAQNEIWKKTGLLA